MKEITLKFREVAVDGEPTETGEYVVVKKYSKYETISTNYSVKHEAFNTRDDQTSKQARQSMIHDILFWVPVDEIDSAFSEDSTNAD